MNGGDEPGWLEMLGGLDPPMRAGSAGGGGSAREGPSVRAGGSGANKRSRGEEAGEE